jgi:hypothetical protein
VGHQTKGEKMKKGNFYKNLKECHRRLIPENDCMGYTFNVIILNILPTY